MSKIIAPNKQFSGLRAGIPFVNGESETDNEYLKGWFRENGYKVIDEDESSSVDVQEVEDAEDEKPQVNLCKGELETLKKPQLQEIAKLLELEFTERTTCEQLIEMIKIAKDMEE